MLYIDLNIANCEPDMKTHFNCCYAKMFDVYLDK